jgi:hypothetical protein
LPVIFAVPFLALFFLLPVAGIVLGIMTAVDVGKYPEWAFGQIGASKTVWQVLPIVLGFFCLGIGGIIMYFMWVTSKRQTIAAAAQRGAPQYGQYGQYGLPPGGWGPPAGAGSWSPPQSPGAAPQYPPSAFPTPAPPPAPPTYPPSAYPPPAPPPGPPPTAPPAGPPQ